MPTEVAPITDLGLYPYGEFQAGRRKLEECLPETLEAGHAYPFLKTGHHNYPTDRTVTLLELSTDDVLFRMRAQVAIEHEAFPIIDGQSYTKGSYTVTELLSA